MFFNEDHNDIRELAREFAEKELAPIANEIDHNDAVPQAIYDKMAQMGFFGLKIPKEYGGIGLDVRSYVSVMEEICKKSITCSLTFSSANSLSTAPILLAGTEEQKQKYVPGIASGKEFMAFGLTEPGAGSDAGAMTTKAVEDGDYYILNGRKTFITGAPFAKNTVVFAKTNPDKGPKGITTFIVDMTLPGVSIGKHEEKMGLRGVATSDVVLEDVRVHKREILGEIDKGFTTAMKTLSIGRIGVACQGIGVAQGALEEAVKHIKERKQFGQFLSEFQALRFMIADMETKINAAKLLVYNAAYKMDMGEDVTKDSSMAKYFATEMSLDVVSKALQMHGGYGYSKEYPIERMYRDARVLTIFEGTSQVQQMVIAGAVLSDKKMKKEETEKQQAAPAAQAKAAPVAKTAAPAAAARPSVAQAAQAPVATPAASVAAKPQPTNQDGKSMNILVCVKQVPNTEELKVDAAAGTSNLETIPKVLSTFDACALETAVRMKDANPSVKIVVVTVGSDKAKDVLKACVAVGADKAYHVNDPVFEDVDSLAVSYVLSLAVRKIEELEGAFDLVFLGRQANDTDAGQVGPQLAEYLGYPGLSYAREVSVVDGKVRATRETEDGYVVMDADIPAVVTVTKTEYDLRFPSVKSKMAANRAEIPVFTAADFGDDAVSIWQPTKTLKTYIPERKSGGIKIEEETGELSAEKLTALLSNAGVI